MPIVYGKLTRSLWLEVRFYIPSPGVTTAKGKGAVGPVQGRRECEPVRRHTMLKSESRKHRIILGYKSFVYDIIVVRKVKKVKN